MMQIRRSTVQTFSGLEKKKEHLNLREGLGELCQHLSHCRQPDQGDHGEPNKPCCHSVRLKNLQRKCLKSPRADTARCRHSPGSPRSGSHTQSSSQRGCWHKRENTKHKVRRKEKLVCATCP